MTVKTINEKDTILNFNGMSAKLMDDSKVVVESMIKTANQATDETRTILAYQQDALKKGFDMWQTSFQAYADFMVQSTERVVDQSIDFRGRMDKVIEDSFKKNQDLVTAERQILLDVAEVYQAQAQSAGAYAAKFLTTASKMMTTTALFSDWAAERVAKMFTSISAN
jgi:hypothetical protein